MTEREDLSRAVEQFLRDQIDSVPHLEALLLLWNNPRQPWSAEGMAKRLFVAPEVAQEILGDLVRKGVIVVDPGTPASWRYEPEPERDRLIGFVQSVYRRELIRISKLIHSKPSLAVREFARAFRLKKENE